MEKAGVIRGGAELKPTTTATSLRFTNGTPKTYDGPFAETKEQRHGRSPAPGHGMTCTSRKVENVVRNDGRRVLAGLIRLTGDFDAAEDALQEACCARPRAPDSATPTHCSTKSARARDDEGDDRRRRRKSARHADSLRRRLSELQFRARPVADDAAADAAAIPPHAEGNPFGANNRFDNVMTQVANLPMSMNAPTASDDAGEGVLPGAAATGESVEDLFFYEEEAATLAKGARGLDPILTAVVPFRHIYQWTIDDRRRRSRCRVALDLAREPRHHPVDHRARAGPVERKTAHAGHAPVHRPLLARRGEHLTIATDVAAERAETEIERKPRDHQRFGYTYDAVVIEGTLTIRNFKREAITLDITRTIEAQAVVSEPHAKVTRLALQPGRESERGARVAGSGSGGETRSVKYRYNAWVRE